MEEGLRRVLVVDQSKVVRSTLAKHLRGHFEVREELNGESAWQSLVLDSSIVAVVSGAQLPKLSGLDLLARLRISKLRRLSDIPFLLVISGHETEEDRQQAREKGVTDFIARGMNRQEILDCIGRLLNWELAMSFAEAPAIPSAIPRNAPLKRHPEEKKVLDNASLCHQLDLAIANQAATSGMVGVLAFGLDDADRLAARFGKEMLASISKRLSQILRTKLGANDSIGCGLIVSPGTSQASCIAFAQRICRGLANSQVTIAGEQLHLIISVGIASVPADANLSANELMALAEKRLLVAQQAGGNRVVADDVSDLGFGFNTEFFSDLMRYYCPNTANVQLGAMGLHLMPLFKAMDKEFRFGLPLNEIERSFELRAREERTG
jgi:two-component system cell cycle response regulator